MHFLLYINFSQHFYLSSKYTCDPCQNAIVRSQRVNFSAGLVRSQRFFTSKYSSNTVYMASLFAIKCCMRGYCEKSLLFLFLTRSIQVIVVTHENMPILNKRPSPLLLQSSCTRVFSLDYKNKELSMRSS